MRFKNVGLLLLLALYALFTSCRNEQKGALSGTVLGSDEIIVSKILPSELVALDTMDVVDGAFFLDRVFDEPTFLLLEFVNAEDPENSIRLPILIGAGEKIKLNVNDTTAYGTFTAEGSKSAERMAKQRDLFAASLNFRDSLEYLNYLYQDSTNLLEERKKWNVDFMARIDFHRKALMKMIDEDSSDLSNIMVFYQSFGQMELFGFEEDFAYYRKVDNGLQAIFPENEHAQYFHQQLQNYKEAVLRQEKVKMAAQNIEVGKIAPEISLNDLEGNLHNLSDLRGKVVLIDFWASWCGPCRRANPELVAIYKKYSAKGFEIYSVSLDGIGSQANAKNDWRFAIEKDGLIWSNHVSDLKGYQSIVVENYGFEGIPFTVLIDANGVILAKNIRGAALEAAIKAVL